MRQGNQFALAEIPAAVTAAGLYSKLCTVQMQNTPQNAVGEYAWDGTYTVIAANLPCQMGVATSSWDKRAGMETRGTDLTEVRKQKQINLDSYHPEIDVQAAQTVDGDTRWVATVGGADYKILSVVHDSQNTFTELLVELITT